MHDVSAAQSITDPLPEPEEARSPGQTPWGWLAVIDLAGCKRAALSSAEVIRGFLSAVVPAVGMEPFGSPQIARFGNGELEGWSAVQFITTSTVTIHADEVSCRCFIDIVSCKRFDPGVAAALAESYFGGHARVAVIERV